MICYQPNGRICGLLSKLKNKLFPVRGKPSSNAIFLVGTTLILLTVSSLQAQEKHDSRDYIVTVDGKEAGSLKIDYVSVDDDSVDVFVRSNIECRVLFLPYSYSLDVRESWHDGRLVSLKSIVNDNGTILRTELRKSGRTFDVTVNDRLLQQISDCNASTTFAVRPRLVGSADQLTLDIDTGKTANLPWSDMGSQDVAVDGANIVGHRFRVSDECGTQVWYDDSNRLIKQTFKDSGSQVMVVQTKRLSH